MIETTTYFPCGAINKVNETDIYAEQSENQGLLHKQMDISAIMRIDQNIEGALEQKHADAYQEMILEPLNETKNGRTGWSQAMDGVAVLTNSFGHIVYSLNMEPQYLRDIQELRNRYELAKSNLHGSDELAVVLQAVHDCSVDTIFVEAGKTISGKFDAFTGEFELGSMDEIECGDIVEDMLIAVMKDKRDIMVLPLGRMPTVTGLAAFFRY